MLIRLIAACLACLALLVLPCGAMAAEEITSFHQVIDLSRDGTMQVTETIKANTEGREIKRGLIRDFPLTFKDDKGRSASVEFQIVGVERDGETEDFHTESISGGIRIYTGKQDVLLEPGEHTFQISYTTSRQIRFFADHDELYWNVNGTGWRFPIREVSATVTLPQGAQVTDVGVYTGRLGETGSDARIQRDNGEVFVATTRLFAIGEGLTFAISMPKGTIDPPTAAQEKLWAVQDNSGIIIGFGGLVLVLAYYMLMWSRVGRDPAAGVMVPRWDAPDGMSPALVNYIDNRGFSGGGWTALSAAVINLAVKGYVTLDNLTTAIVISRTGKAGDAALGIGEAALLAQLPANGTLSIDSANGETVQQTGAKFRAAIEKEHRGRYYKANTGYIVLGVALSIAVLIAVVVFGGLSDDTVGLLLGPAIVSTVVGSMVVRAVLTLFQSHGLFAKIKLIFFLAVFAFVGTSLISGVLSTVYFDLTEVHELPLFVAVGGIVLTNVVFFFLMGAPTSVGRKAMDGIAGLRQYLTLAEKDRMNMAGVPTMSPQHFETLLPYAVALGVEKPWSQTFDTWFAAAAAGAAATAYQPVWYVGSFNGQSFAGSIGGFASSMSSTIASTIPAPVSSSSSGSSGGGSSGGGGGGGGGGGW